MGLQSQTCFVLFTKLICKLCPMFSIFLPHVFNFSFLSCLLCPQLLHATHLQVAYFVSSPQVQSLKILILCNLHLPFIRYLHIRLFKLQATPSYGYVFNSSSTYIKHYNYHYIQILHLNSGKVIQSKYLPLSLLFIPQSISKLSAGITFVLPEVHSRISFEKVLPMICFWSFASLKKYLYFTLFLEDIFIGHRILGFFFFLYPVTMSFK